ncbi:hypothetical protein HPB48_007771 [Haemaphysalis longicornis]|uniref:Uncharacterized protein n=1 Tax=Haemaphysalis longicornis TaxID=44386 RepID=A0A9J6FRZ9_HAELO|nr:hypothetical protein HPB48_007771 [Haemaphysalis longicornis]
MVRRNTRRAALSRTSLSESTDEILSAWKRQFERGSTASESTSSNDRGHKAQRCHRPLPSFEVSVDDEQGVPGHRRGAVDVEGQLCNHSPKPFRVESGLPESCVHSGAPAERCLDTPIFSSCGRDDVTVKLWYFNGHTCSAWTFPMGKCPGNQTGLFATFADCLERCVKRPGGRRLCGSTAPAPSNDRTCDVRELRYPFFAHRVGKHVRCLAAPVTSPAKHRCLVGTNRFATRAACERTCITHSTYDEALVP